MALDRDLTKLLNKKYETISLDGVDEYFKKEAGIVEDFVEEMNTATSDSYLKIVNKYLEVSDNVHQIGVSANLITKDDYLIFEERGKGEIDGSGKGLYPSTNGNAEVLSDKVEFYKYSSKEDLPTISINDSFRMDFNGELSRETSAELKLDLNDLAWDTLGLAISGAAKPFYQNGDELCPCHRMHFNVIMMQHVEQNFDEVFELQKQATEAYETAKIVGIRAHVYKSEWSRIGHYAGKLLDFVKEHSEAMEKLITIMVMFMLNQNVAEYVGQYNAISLVLIGIIFIDFLWNTINKVRHHYKYYRFNKSYSLTCDNYESMLDTRVNEFLDTYTPHPVVFDCLNLYWEYLRKQNED